MSAEMFDELHSHITRYLSSKSLSEDQITEYYNDRAWPLERARWDVLHYSGFPVRRLYDAGLQDPHIDTALRKILHH